MTVAGRSLILIVDPTIVGLPANRFAQKRYDRMTTGAASGFPSTDSMNRRPAFVPPPSSPNQFAETKRAGNRVSSFSQRTYLWRADTSTLESAVLLLRMYSMAGYGRSPPGCSIPESVQLHQSLGISNIQRF